MQISYEPRASSPVGPRARHDAPVTTTTTTTTTTAASTTAGTATMKDVFFKKRLFGALTRKAPVWCKALGRGENVLQEAFRTL